MRKFQIICRGLYSGFPPPPHSGREMKTKIRKQGREIKRKKKKKEGKKKGKETGYFPS